MKRLLSLALCICLLLSMMPNWTIGVHAEDDEAEQTVVQEEQVQKEEPEAGEETAEKERSEQAEEFKEEDAKEEEDIPEDSEEKDNEKQYPWDDMTDEEFYEWVMAEENRDYLRTIMFTDYENIYYSLFDRVECIDDSKIYDSVSEILIRITETNIAESVDFNYYTTDFITSEQIESAITWVTNYLTPYNFSSSNPYYGLCVALPMDGYENGAGFKGIQRASTATELGNRLITNTDANPPRGALVFWAVKNVPAGHVALSLGGGKVIHYWTSQGAVQTIAQVNSWGSGYTYRGWGSPIKGAVLATDTSSGGSSTTTETISFPFSVKATSDTDAIIDWHNVSNPGKVNCPYAGVMWSTSDLSLVKAATKSDIDSSTVYNYHYDKMNANYVTATSIPMLWKFKDELEKNTCDGGKANHPQGTLKSGMTYYVREFVIDSSNKVHLSDVKSFTTTGTHTHTWNSGTVTTAATCAATGVKTYTCTVCNATKTETIAKLTSHTWGSWTKVDDTNHKRTCTVCGTAETAAHSWGSWAAVTGTNNHKRTCSACGTAETAIHSFSYVENPKPTATSTGTITGTCNTCKYVITDTFPVISDKDYVRTVFQEPSYSEKGYSKYTWKNTAYGDRCFVIQDIPALKAVTKITLNVTDITICKDQEFILSATVAPSDAANKGVHWKTSNANVATRNFNTQTVHANGVGTAVFTAEADDYQGAVATCTVHVVDHDWSNSEVITEATCNADGVMKYTCSLCKGSKTETIAKLTTHTWGSWTKADEVNHKRVCSVCSTEEMQLHECSYSVTKEPTKAVQGTLTGVCSKCSGTKQIALPVLNETSYSYRVVKEPTTTAAGTAEYTWKNTEYGTVCITVELPAVDEGEKGAISVASVTGMAGKTVEVAVSITENPGVASMQLTVNYDTSAMKLVAVTDSQQLGDAAHSDDLEACPYTLCWANDLATTNFTYCGEIVRLQFEILENAAVGDYPIEVTYDPDNFEIFDVDGEPVNFVISAGVVKVIDVLIGDVNSDGRVNAQDRMILTRYLAKWKGYTVDTVNLIAADVNCDGRVNAQDRMILTRYLAKWKGYTALPYGA